MTTQEKVSKLKSIVDKDIAIYCETVEEDRALCELANDYFYGEYSDYCEDTYYAVESFSFSNNKIEICYQTEDDVKYDENYKIIPYSEFFKDTNFTINATNRELLILRDWINHRFEHGYESRDGEMNTISFKVDDTEVTDNGSGYINSIPTRYKERG